METKEWYPGAGLCDGSRNAQHKEEGLLHSGKAQMEVKGMSSIMMEI